MSDLPNYIILVTCKHSKKNKDIVKIFKEYFNSLPHIKYTDCNLDSNDTYFIFPVIDIVRSTIYKLDGYNNILSILGYSLYKYEQDWSLILSTYGICLNSYTLNPQYLPATVKIDPNDIKKLESLSEDWDYV